MWILRIWSFEIIIQASSFLSESSTRGLVFWIGAVSTVHSPPYELLSCDYLNSFLLELEAVSSIFIFDSFKEFLLLLVFNSDYGYLVLAIGSKVPLKCELLVVLVSYRALFFFITYHYLRFWTAGFSIPSLFGEILPPTEDCVINEVVCRFYLLYSARSLAALAWFSNIFYSSILATLSLAWVALSLITICCSCSSSFPSIFVACSYSACLASSSSVF